MSVNIQLICLKANIFKRLLQKNLVFARKIASMRGARRPKCRYPKERK